MLYNSQLGGGGGGLCKAINYHQKPTNNKKIPLIIIIMKTFQLSKVINSYGSVETNMLFQHVKQLEAMDMLYTSQLEQT